MDNHITKRRCQRDKRVAGPFTVPTLANLYFESLFLYTILESARDHK